MVSKQSNCFNFVISFLIITFSFLKFVSTVDSSNVSLSAPRFITQYSSSIVSEGRTKILQCQAIGYPTPQYQWLKDGRILTDFSTESFYRILRVQRSDAGSYQCIAKNDVGAIFSQKIDLSVAFMGFFDDSAEKVISAKTGDAVIIDLPSIESYPTPSVIWQTDNYSPLPYRNKYFTTSKQQLVILSVDKNDEKIYRACATNMQFNKEEYGPFIRLVVNESSDMIENVPKIIIKPNTTKVTKGQVAEMECVANSRELHELETLWFKDGVAIEETDLSYNFRDPWNRTLSLTTNLSYSGNYTCQIRLKTETDTVVSASAELFVYDKPVFIHNIQSELWTDYGSGAKLYCNAMGVPQPEIVWFKNTENITHLIGSRYFLDDDNTLVIDKVSVEDAGMFQCLARNDVGENLIATWLKVKTAVPVFQTAPKNATLLDGKNVTISCRVFGAPMPNVTWLLNDTETIEESSRIRILEAGDLFINAVKISDMGKYTCLRANEAGVIEAHSFLKVIAKTQIVKAPENTKVLLGETATLHCKVSNDETVPYQLDWYHNKIKIQSGLNQRVNVLSDGSLKVKAVRAADVGQYICVVKSPGGNDTKNAYLSVIELPFAPINLKAIKVENVTDRRAVNLTWTAGFDGNSPIRQFVIQKRELPNIDSVPDTLINWIVELNNVSANHKWILLTNLKAATAYQFRVSAVNSVGEGSPSKPSNIIVLPQEVPSGPPQNFVGSARSSSEVIVQWHPPLEEHRNGNIIGYIIRYRLFGYKISWNYLNITNEAQRNFLIQDLITWKDYVIQVAAYNSKGVGVFSPGITIKTKEGIPEAAPEILNITAINSTAIEIWWLPPNPQKINGINQGYKIQAWIGHVESKMMTVAPNLLHPLVEQFAIMNGLRKFTNYNISILCFTDPGDGELSEFVSVKTLEDVPDEVSALHFSEISDRAVKVSWSPPKSANGVLLKYQLKYQIKDRPDSLKVHQLLPNTTSIKINKLKATTNYRFEITAWTAKGSSVAKMAVIQSGIEPVLPKPPTKLALSNIEAFSVVLQFTPGFNGNSSITKWTVEAKTTRNVTWFPIFEIEDPDATTITVSGLIPFTIYRLRIISNNVVGASEPSISSKEFQTIQASPAHPPLNVTVRAISSTELKVRWIPLQQIEWYGNPRGYNITYSELNSGKTKSVVIDDHTANSYVIKELEEFTIYTVYMKAFNDVGTSISSPLVKDRTRESVPSAGPFNITANATSSTTIVVQWGDVPKDAQNGIIEGYKVFYGAEGQSSAPQHRSILNNQTFTITLTELRKFTVYYIQVLAFTRLGDGVPSKPAISLQTFDDVPGPPSNVSFPDVSLTTARIIWDVPVETNGEILAYKVTYQLDDVDNYLKYNEALSHEFSPSDRTFSAINLDEERYYLFTVTAKTRLGWGKTAQGLVFTTNNRQLPQSPSVPQINQNQVLSDQITINWIPGRDGFAPLRFYTVQYAENEGNWMTITERVEPQAVSFMVTKLKPFTFYKFRIQATNDIGPSAFSNESMSVRTLSAAPSKPVTHLKAVPITTNSVQVIWRAIDLNSWSGDSETGGYKVIYQPISDFSSSALRDLLYEEIHDINANEMILKNLQQDRNYEIVVEAFNSQGDGPKSSPVTVYVGEAVPTGYPTSFEGEAISSTEVRLRWKPMEKNLQNGDLLGYKIFYLVTYSPQEINENISKIEEEIEIVPASYTSYSLIFLDKFTEYRIQILAFNPAGDGPRSKSITVQTFQGPPGAPKSIDFEDITMNSLKVFWGPPKKRNGIIVGYLVTYETCEQNDKFSKQVKQKVNSTSLLIQSLEENITYTFTIRAQTVEYGPIVTANVTTGPQDGSPATPKEFSLIRTDSSVDLNWVNGPSGKGPILGYYIEGKSKDELRWQVVTKTTNGALEEFSISYQSLMPSTHYHFRLVAYNKYGVSNPIYAGDPVLTPSKLYLEYRYLQQKPFYRQTWFMVVLAATSTVIIIMIIAVLCVKSQSYKYKEEARLKLEESLSTLDLDDRHDFNMSLYRSRHEKSFSNGCVTISKRSTLSRKLIHQSAAMLAKSPPRPSPGLVTYHSDDESAKDYDENPDDSSATDKPSEMSSTETQNSDESENDSERSRPLSFANHYANVNDSLRQTWKRQKPIRNDSMMSNGNGSDVPDGPIRSSPPSENHNSSILNLSVSTANPQMLVNNMARSRAPLPGFSSFV